MCWFSAAELERVGLGLARRQGCARAQVERQPRSAVRWHDAKAPGEGEVADPEDGFVAVVNALERREHLALRVEEARIDANEAHREQDFRLEPVGEAQRRRQIPVHHDEVEGVGVRLFFVWDAWLELVLVHAVLGMHERRDPMQAQPESAWLQAEQGALTSAREVRVASPASGTA